MGGLVIAGDRSGSGKTTVTLALLAALRARGETVQAFKVGPDYIDPMFHREITGRPAYNLDPVLTSETYVQQCFQQHRAAAPYAVVEGVMGLVDGAGGTDYGSTAHIARLLHCPVLLVVDCASLSRSLAAIVHGYRTLDSRLQLAGVVLNRVGSDRHLAMLKGAIAAIQVPVLGVLRRDDAVTLPDRHLGLVPTDELPDLPERFRHLAALGQRCFDWQQLTPIFQAPLPPTQPTAGSLLTPLTKGGMSTPASSAKIPRPRLEEEFRVRANDGCAPDAKGDATARLPDSPIRLAVARDRAFNFYYEDNLASLAALGATLLPFSPLGDTALPPDIDGLILGGGFPEMFAATLSENVALRTAIAQALAAGLPTYAECGGLMYLCRELVDFAGRSHFMVDHLPATTTMTGKLTLGYRQVTVQQSSPLVQAGQQLWGHEFHRSTIAPAPNSPLYALSTYPLLGEAPLLLPQEGWSSQHLHASYVHLHWGDRPELPGRFLAECDRYRHQRPA